MHQGGCRTVEGGKGVHDTHNVPDENECKTLCDKLQEGCLGYEWGNTCETHTATITHGSGEDSSICYIWTGNYYHTFLS